MAALTCFRAAERGRRTCREVRTPTPSHAARSLSRSRCPDRALPAVERLPARLLLRNRRKPACPRGRTAGLERSGPGASLVLTPHLALPLSSPSDDVSSRHAVVPSRGGTADLTARGPRGHTQTLVHLSFLSLFPPDVPGPRNIRRIPLAQGLGVQTEDDHTGNCLFEAV